MKSNETKQHSRTSLSSAHRWLECPGSIPFSETLPPLPETPEMRAGTEAHRKAIGDKKFDGALMRFAKGDVNYLAPCEGDEDLEGFVEHVLLKRAEHKPPKVLLEEPVTIDEGLDLFGTLDVAMRTGKKSAVIVDLKWGAGYAVPAEGNPQLAGYAAALDAEFGRKTPFESIEVQIYQPRAFHPLGPVRSWTLDRAEIETWGKRLREGAKVVSKMSKDDPSTWGKLKTGDWCRTCPCAGVCPALAIHTEPARGVIEAAPVEDAALAVFEGASVESVIAERVQALTPEEVSRVLQAGELAEAFLKAVRKRALADALAGSPPTGWKVVSGKGRRFPSDDAEQQLAAQGVEMFEMVRKQKTLKVLEKELGKAGKKRIDELWVKRPGAPTLVPVSDPRLPYEATGGACEFPDDLEGE